MAPGAGLHEVRVLFASLRIKRIPFAFFPKGRKRAPLEEKSGLAPSVFFRIAVILESFFLNVIGQFPFPRAKKNTFRIMQLPYPRAKIAVGFIRGNFKIIERLKTLKGLRIRCKFFIMEIYRKFLNIHKLSRLHSHARQ